MDQFDNLTAEEIRSKLQELTSHERALQLTLQYFQARLFDKNTEYIEDMVVDDLVAQDGRMVSEVTEKYFTYLTILTTRNLRV